MLLCIPHLRLLLPLNIIMDETCLSCPGWFSLLLLHLLSCLTPEYKTLMHALSYPFSEEKTMVRTTFKIGFDGSDLFKHTEWPTKQTSCSSSVASHQQRCREEEKTGVCARAVEDVTCEWNIVVLRGNKKEVEGVRRGKGTKTKSGFCV